MFSLTEVVDYEIFYKGAIYCSWL